MTYLERLGDLHHQLLWARPGAADNLSCNCRTCQVVRAYALDLDTLLRDAIIREAKAQSEQVKEQARLAQMQIGITRAAQAESR